MGVEAQRPRRGHRRILLAQRAGGGVARIGELARLGRILGLGEQARVERGEIGLRHIDLAAHLEHVGRVAVQPLRDVGDGADIGGDVLAGRAVAAGRGEDQRALLVAQRAGQAVDLGLGGERDLGVVSARFRKRRTRADEIGHLLVGEGIVEAEHRQRVRGPWRDAPAGAAPTCRDGLSSRTRCGNCASSAALRRTSAS